MYEVQCLLVYGSEAGAAALQPAVLTVEQLNRFLRQYFFA